MRCWYRSSLLSKSGSDGSGMQESDWSRVPRAGSFRPTTCSRLQGIQLPSVATVPAARNFEGSGGKALHSSVHTVNLNRANISKAVSTPSRQLRLHFALTGHRLTAAPSHFAACSLPLASTSLHSCRHFTVQNHVTYTLVQSEEHQNSVSMVGPDVLKSQYKNLIRS